jgi:hypothetical protein
MNGRTLNYAIGLTGVSRTWLNNAFMVSGTKYMSGPFMQQTSPWTKSYTSVAHWVK